MTTHDVETPDKKMRHYVLILTVVCYKARVTYLPHKGKSVFSDKSADDINAQELFILRRT